VPSKTPVHRRLHANAGRPETTRGDRSGRALGDDSAIQRDRHLYVFYLLDTPDENGVAGAVTVFEWQDVEGYNTASDFAPLILTSVMALAMPAMAAVTVPRLFASGLLAGWFFSAAAAMAFVQHFGLYGYTVILLIVLTVIGLTQSRQTRGHHLQGAARTPPVLRLCATRYGHGGRVVDL
jgi:hypothetical protein